MPSTKRNKQRPHPRSLDVLFPKPKVRRCTGGHSQTPEWRPSHGCSTCRRRHEEEAQRALERERVQAGLAQAERAAWAERLGRPPAVMEIRVVQTGQVMRFTTGRARPRRRRR